LPHKTFHKKVRFSKRGCKGNAFFGTDKLLRDFFEKNVFRRFNRGFLLNQKFRHIKKASGTKDVTAGIKSIG
jgi:hypothetical protein